MSSDTIYCRLVLQHVRFRKILLLLQIFLPKKPIFMQMTPLYAHLQRAREQRQKQLAVLIDPDKATPEALSRILRLANAAGVDYLFVGGSLLVRGETDACIQQIKSQSTIPVILFPGNHIQVSSHADAILLLSLISGRNPDFLIGQHVVAAPALRKSGLEIIPTAYMLIDGGRATSASYISNTMPIPANKPEIAASTAIAGEMLGLKMIYLEAGSGAMHPVSPEMIAEVHRHTRVPLIVGGGIRSAKQALMAAEAGADLIVIGTAFEKNPELLPEIAAALKNFGDKP